MNQMNKQTRKRAARELLRCISSGVALTLAEYVLAEEVLVLASPKWRMDAVGPSETQPSGKPMVTDLAGQLGS